MIRIMIMITKIVLLMTENDDRNDDDKRNTKPPPRRISIEGVVNSSEKLAAITTKGIRYTFHLKIRKTFAKGVKNYATLR